MFKKPLLIILALCLALSIGIGLATRTGSGAPSRAAAIAPVNDAWRAALPRDPEAATAAYMARLSPEASARANSYFRGGYWLNLWNLIVTLGSAWLLLGTGTSAAMRDWSERITRRKPLQTMLYATLFALATTVLSLPLSVFAGFMREHWYGLAAQSFGAWFGEQILAILVSTVLMSLLLAVLYGVIRRFERSWWILGTVVAMGFMVVTMLIAPLYIDPLFNKYRSLEDGPVKQAILSMARANGVPAQDVLQFDQSKQHNRVSANVSGLLGTTAVRLNDNLLNRCTPAQIKGVMAHELGHYVLNHIYKILLPLALILAAGFAFVSWSFAWVMAHWGKKWGLRGVGDTAGLPLFLALFSVFMTFMSPIQNTLIRVHEVEADLFALNASPEPDAIAEVELLLTEYRNPDPGAVEEFLFCDHPSPRNRIFYAMRWKAEHWQEPLSAPAGQGSEGIPTPQD